MLLENKVALVTGGGSGIGRAIAQVLAREGAKVVVADIHPEGGEETVAQVRAAGGDAVFQATDVGILEQSRAAVERAVRHYGRLDVACNNAAIGGGLLPTADYPVEAWAQVIHTNLTGVFYGMKCQIPALLQAGGGAIINTASIMSEVGFANSPAYTASKHGVMGLTRSAALEYASQGLRINAVGPGFVHTPMIGAINADPAVYQALVAQHAVGRLGEPKEVAELVAWLASPRASFVCGAFYAIDGGYLAR